MVKTKNDIRQEWEGSICNTITLLLLSTDLQLITHKPTSLQKMKSRYLLLFIVREHTKN